MTISSKALLAEIEVFISRTGMGESYFGKKSVGNSELISRLRANRRIWPDTEERVRAFMKEMDHPTSNGPAASPIQAQPTAVVNAPRKRGAS